MDAFHHLSPFIEWFSPGPNSFGAVLVEEFTLVLGGRQAVR